jgi:regulatory protein YycI of two-component signal transduction system YycFG
MEQREILSNRQEFLQQEQVAITKEISKSKAKGDILEKKKLKEKVKVLNKNDLKLEDQYNQIIKR